MHTGFLAVPALFSALRWQQKKKKGCEKPGESSGAPSQEGAGATARPQPRARVQGGHGQQDRGTGTPPALGMCSREPPCALPLLRFLWMSPQNWGFGNWVP